MSNILDNGAVLPSGLLSTQADAFMEGFNRSYRDFKLKVGVIVEEFPASNASNRSKLSTEYNVVVIEQNEDKGATTLLYRNCLSAEGLGSIADFFEKALRPSTAKNNKGTAINTKGQNGAIVLLLCLDGASDKGIIIGALTHPDRDTTLVEAGPRLEGEYNGVNIKVEKDGSTSLTFSGATDNYGKPLDASQGDTVISIEKDGSYQVKHKTITNRLDKNGAATLTAEGDITNTTKKNFNLSATENIALLASKDFSLSSKKFTVSAEGSAALECQRLALTSKSDVMVKGSTLKVEAEAMATIKAPSITLDGRVSLGGKGGKPMLLMTAQFLGIGNKGAPVVSHAISGFTTKVVGK